MAKRTRIFTNRNWPDSESVELIEVDEERGQFFWRIVDRDYYEGYWLEGCFPVDMQFVAEKFAEHGREFDRSKFPHCAGSRVSAT